MLKVIPLLKALLLSCGCIALVSLAIAMTSIATSVQQAADAATAIQKVAVSLPPTMTAEVEKQSLLARSGIDLQLGNGIGMIDRHLSELQLSVDSAKVGLLVQAGGVSASAQKLLEDADAKTLPAANALLSNEDVPGLIRDARRTTAFTGQTMRHVETLADQAAIAAPAMIAQTQSIAKSVDGISKDVKVVTDDLVAPRPWYKKAWNLLMDASNVRALF